MHKIYLMQKRPIKFLAPSKRHCFLLLYCLLMNYVPNLCSRNALPSSLISCTSSTNEPEWCLQRSPVAFYLLLEEIRRLELKHYIIPHGKMNRQTLSLADVSLVEVCLSHTFCVSFSCGATDNRLWGKRTSFLCFILLSHNFNSILWNQSSSSVQAILLEEIVMIPAVTPASCTPRN